MKHHDVIIIGAGIIGLSIGWQLARRSKLSILVLEKGAGLGEGSTGASSAVCRHRYSLDTMVELARDGIDLYRDWQNFTGLSEPRAGFHNDGVLWLAGTDTEWAGREQQRMGQFDVRCEVLDDAELCRRFPGYNPCILAPDLETGEPHDCLGGGRHLLELDGGYMDPALAAEDLREACVAAGVEIRLRSQVSDIVTGGGRVEGVSLSSGESLATPLVVNAAGPWCRELYDAAGVKLGWDLAPIRVQIVYLDRPPELEGHIPVTADIGSGIYFRTQNRGQQLVLGSVLEEDEREEVSRPDDFLREIDSDFEVRKLHLLQHRLPGLAAHGKVRGYCGLYTMNRDDVHPILGESALPGFWVANGFSGHGFKLAPAIGALMAQAVTGATIEGDTAVPIDTYSINRDPIKLETLNVLA
jgi:glycine/D-amino acid oxidase-like deaminating enzyme